MVIYKEHQLGLQMIAFSPSLNSVVENNWTICICFIRLKNEGLSLHRWLVDTMWQTPCRIGIEQKKFLIKQTLREIVSIEIILPCI